MSNRLVGKYCTWSHQMRLTQSGQRCPDCECRSIPCRGREAFATVTRYAAPYRPRPAQTATASETYAAAAAALDAATAEFNKVGPRMQALGQHATLAKYSRRLEALRVACRDIAARDTALRAEHFQKAVAYATSKKVTYVQACEALGVQP